MITLSTLHEASAQEVFTQVKDHLLKQNEKSMIDNLCAYRGSNGLQCAAGCLMSDEEAKYIPEEKAWRTLLDQGFVETYKHTDLIFQLQDIHDSELPEEWPESLQRLAFDEGLNY
jgi:hypothetical protein